MTIDARGVIAIDHPALAGHFPGNPIVPGVLILDEVLRVLEECRGQVRLTRVVSVKFTSPLKPDEVFHIKIDESGESHIEFECTLDGRALASGRLVVEPGPGRS